MNRYRNTIDSDLVQMALLGNNQAFEELVRRYERAVMSTALKITSNRYSAEDASQDAFVSAWMNLSSLHDGGKFRPWVCAIAKNHAKTIEFRYKSTIPNISLDEIDFDIPDCPELDVFEYDDLYERINALSEKIRETVKLHYFNELSVKEIAIKLSISEGTVKWRLSEGRKQLRKGYGVMEKSYDENETVVERVMYQVEHLKLWRLKEDKNGFEAEYRAVLDLVNELPESKEKNCALADTLLMGAWWIDDERNDETYRRIKQAAELGHNESVMEAVASYEWAKLSGNDRIDYIRNVQIPYFEKNGFTQVLGYVLYWLGYEYRVQRLHDEALAAFTKATVILPPENVYYAAAKAAIFVEKNSAVRGVGEYKSTDFSAYGESHRIIDGKIYLWEQPGYCETASVLTFSVFWNMSACDRMIYNPDMKLGDSIETERGKNSLTFIAENETIRTSAGVFEKCNVYELNCKHNGLLYSKTYLCKGVGIVYQEVIRDTEHHIWELSNYKILGGDGDIPYACGNCWEYKIVTSFNYAVCEVVNSYEVTGFQKGCATLSSSFYKKVLSYNDSFEGKLAEVYETYWCDNMLVDVRPALERAKQLAKTDSEKLHISVAENAMLRIMNTDPIFNPQYTEKGIWNFFNNYPIKKCNRETHFKWSGEHFEWKDAGNLDDEGMKMLYSFFDKIVESCGMGVWSDKWVHGFSLKPSTAIKSFEVLEDETVITPAGRFENCRHISFHLDYNYYFGGQSECWYAEGIGFVKFTHKINSNVTAVWYLTEYKGVGEGFFPTDDGLYRKYEPEQIGNGFRAALEYHFSVDAKGANLFRNATGVQARTDYEKVLK